MKWQLSFRLLSLSLLWFTALPAYAQDSPQRTQNELNEIEPNTIPEVELSLNDCIHQALKANLGLQVERLGPEISRFQLAQQWGQYGLSIGADALVNQNVSPSNTSFIEGASIINQIRQNYNLFLEQQLVSGGSLRLGLDNTIINTNSTRADLNPAFTPRLALNLEHPLLRNALNGLREIEIQENAQRSAQWSLKGQAIDTVAEVQDAYWSLVLFRERLRVQEQALKILEDLLEMNREKEKAGFMSRIDVLQTEARIASRQASLLEARRNLANTEDRLKQSLNPTLAGTGQDFIAWDSPLKPLDKPVYTPYKVSVESSYTRALAQLPELQSLQLELRNRHLREDIAGQNRLPALRLRGSSGLESLDGNYPNALGKLFSLQTYFWSLGVSFEVPVVGNSFEALYQQTRLQREQQELRVESTAQRVLREIRQAVRNVDMSGLQVKATQRATALAEEQLKAQTEKLNLGLTTNFQVLQFQSDFESASLAEVNAVVAYIQAVNRLQQLEGSLLEALKN